MHEGVGVGPAEDVIVVGGDGIVAEHVRGEGVGVSHCLNSLWQHASELDQIRDALRLKVLIDGAKGCEDLVLSKLEI